LKAEGCVQVAFEIPQSLSWIGVNQVKAEIFESRISDDLQCFHCFIGGVNPTEKLEQLRLEGLYANADAIHPTSAVARKVLTFHGSRVRFQGDFTVRIDREQPTCALENARETRRLKSRRRAAAKEDRLDSSTVPIIEPGIMIQLLNQCFSVACFRDVRDDVRVKIAVGTFADAIGNMNVKGKGLLFSRHHSFIIVTKGGRYNSLGIIVAKAAARRHPVTHEGGGP
jgi:hypothetical protein